MGDLAAQTRRRAARADLRIILGQRAADHSRRAHAAAATAMRSAASPGGGMGPAVAGNMGSAIAGGKDGPTYGQLQQAMALRVKYRLNAKNPKRKLNCQSMGVHLMNRGNHEIYPNGGDAGPNLLIYY